MIVHFFHYTLIVVRHHHKILKSSLDIICKILDTFVLQRLIYNCPCSISFFLIYCWYILSECPTLQQHVGSSSALNAETNTNQIELTSGQTPNLFPRALRIFDMTMNNQGRPTRPEDTASYTPFPTHTGNRALEIAEPLIFEVGDFEGTGVDLPKAEGIKPRIAGFDRQHAPHLPGRTFIHRVIPRAPTDL